MIFFLFSIDGSRFSTSFAIVTTNLFQR
jgi:hypothetical protein